MISKIHSVVPCGFEGELVEVEGDMNRGLPAFNIVGMANKTINEAKERVRSAVVNSDFSFPDKRVTINLAPAELLKDGAYLDLPIALAILTLSGQLTKSDTENRAFVGELSLDGRIMPVRGIINIVEAAKKAGYQEIFVPIKNLSQASLISGITIYGVETLQRLYLVLKNQTTPHTAARIQNDARVDNTATTEPILDHIRGQALVKRAMEIAIAGHHNILISGPPGAGKTLLAKAGANLLPDLTTSEIVEITKIYSIAGLGSDEIVTRRPFRAPHHSASTISVIGGGTTVRPGEISLAHKGILFLDEIPEFPRSILESLRQPLEDRQIAISRANRKSIYPADFMLVATMNPCPCGYFGDPTHECKCTEVQIQNYQKKLSGPLFDRIDMNVVAEKISNQDLRTPIRIKDYQSGASFEKFNTCHEKSQSSFAGSSHAVVKNNITEAMLRQKVRYGRDGVYNGSLSSFEVTEKLKLDPAAEKLLAQASEKLNLSARSYFKTIKVAQTIADLEDTEIIKQNHLAEALTYRQR